jgi:hypothetical protein
LNPLVEARLNCVRSRQRGTVLQDIELVEISQRA